VFQNKVLNEENTEKEARQKGRKIGKEQEEKSGWNVELTAEKGKQVEKMIGSIKLKRLEKVCKNWKGKT
jgi:hypothetical protein